jgi:hypothetical protein
MLSYGLYENFVRSKLKAEGLSIPDGCYAKLLRAKNSIYSQQYGKLLNLKLAMRHSQVQSLLLRFSVRY